MADPTTPTPSASVTAAAAAAALSAGAATVKADAVADIQAKPWKTIVVTLVIGVALGLFAGHFIPFI